MLHINLIIAERLYKFRYKSIRLRIKTPKPAIIIKTAFDGLDNRYRKKP